MQVVIEIQDRTLGTRCCDNDPLTEVSQAEAQQLSDDFQIFGHPVRIQILNMLGQQAGQVCVCDLEAALPVKQPTVSHHLRLLREAGLIDCERHGQWAYYFINRDAVATRVARMRDHFAPLL